MSDFLKLYENYIKMLKSDDPSERRSAIEEFMAKDIDEEIAQLLTSALIDPDKGVRDSASITLTYNGHPSIPKFVVPYISSTEISVRNLAGEILLRIGEPAIEPMIKYLEDANDDDQKFLIDIMGLIGSEIPVTEITRVLDNSTNENVILACLEALGNIKNEDSVEKLIEFYEKNELYKPTIIEALGKIESQKVLDFIISKYNDEDELTKFSIIESLGNLGNEQTFFFLLSELTKIKGPLIWPVISSLQELKQKFGLDLPFDESIKNSILYTLLEAEQKYKRAAASLITVFDDKDILDALLKIYGSDFETDENIKPAFFQLSSIVYPKVANLIKQAPENLKNLLWLLKELGEFNNFENLNELSELDKRSLSDAFILCLDNPDEEVRRTSVELLFAVNLETALVFVDSMIEDDNIWNRLKILELLENVFDPRVNDVFKKLMNDPEEMIKERAAWSLAQRGITV